MNKRNLVLLFFLAIILQLNLSHIQVAEAHDYSNPEMMYVPKEDISVSKSVEKNTFTFYENTKKYAASTVSEDFLNDCSTNYAFLQLEDKEKSSKMKTLYVEILYALTEVYEKTDKDIELMQFSDQQLYCIGAIPYSTLGLDDSEAFDVFMRVLADHPIIYFVKEMLVQDGTQLYLIASEEFYAGSVRKDYNSRIKEAITSIGSDTVNMTSNYQIVKYVHDSVINQVDYAYEGDTKEPRDDDYVHSIAGYVSDSKEVVCDGYTETMAAILNYLDIETVCGFGWGVKQGEETSKETAHAWNIVKLGNNKYYAIDATWDDAGDGITYNYFCLGENFYDTHSTIRNDNETGTSFIYELPQLSTEDFVGEDGLLKIEDPVYDAEVDIAMTGKYNGYSYEMADDGTIAFTGYTGNETKVEVPSNIKGHMVVSISNCFNYNNIIKEIVLPDTINNIGFVGCECSELEKLTINAYKPENKGNVIFTYMNGIFTDCKKLKTIIVNENDNFKSFWAEDNILYFGDSDDIQLVLYPGGKTDQRYNFEYAMKIGSCAFQGNDYIKEVVFKEDIRDVTQLDGAIHPSSNIFYHCENLERVVFKSKSPAVIAGWFDGCTSLKTFEIPETVTSIKGMAFNGCSSLKEIVIPQGVSYIGSASFQDCTSLESCIIYNDNIEFESPVIDGKEQESIWNGSNKLIVHCNAGSSTENYAKKFGIAYAPIGSNLKINITFWQVGGTLKTVNKQVMVGEAYGELPKPYRKGFTFTGWYTEAVNGTKIDETAKVAVKEDITLYAHWKKVTVKKTTISSLNNKKKKQLVIKWKKVSDADGYRVTYATDKKLKKGKKTVFVTKKNTSKIIKKLKKGKIYYVKVQAYKIDSTGSKIYGSCKKIKKIKIKK
jgi:uncharacterized repeat protein (TIGR02543 family)